ncbi:hypothetical protein J7M02_07755 [Candidatus Aerophobetes bacterium]|nr:hypothetical protein [Candidatus Aerophobetes bacterium]
MKQVTIYQHAEVSEILNNSKEFFTDEKQIAEINGHMFFIRRDGLKLYVYIFPTLRLIYEINLNIACYDVMRGKGGSPFYWDEDYNPLSHPHRFERVDEPEFIEGLQEEWLIWHPEEEIPEEFYVEKK